MATQEMGMSNDCKGILTEARNIALSSKSGRACSIAVAIAILTYSQSEAYQLINETLNEIGSWSILDLQESLRSALPRRRRHPKLTGAKGKIVNAIIEYAQILAIEDNRIECTDFDLLRAVIIHGGAASRVFRDHRITRGALEEKRRMNAA